MHTEIHGSVQKQLLVRSKCWYDNKNVSHKHALSFATGEGARKILSFPWISFSLRSLTNMCCNTRKMEGYMKRNLNIFCLILLHGKHMMRGKGRRKVQKCMMPQCPGLPKKIHIFNRNSVNILGSVQP